MFRKHLIWLVMFKDCYFTSCRKTPIDFEARETWAYYVMCNVCGRDRSFLKHNQHIFSFVCEEVDHENSALHEL